MIIVLSPEGKAPSATKRVPVLAKLPDLNGKVLGFLDNGKPNADMLQQRFEERLKQTYKIAGVIRRRKLSAQQAAPKQHIEDLAAKADFVISGLGD